MIQQSVELTCSCQNDIENRLHYDVFKPKFFSLKRAKRDIVRQLRPAPTFSSTMKGKTPEENTQFQNRSQVFFHAYIKCIYVYARKAHFVLKTNLGFRVATRRAQHRYRFH